MAAANGRLLKELKEVTKDDTSGIKAAPVVEGNLRHLKGTIPGPSGTPYEGGVFEIDIVIPKQYPFEPPKMKYMTKIWHPNISSQTGAICLVRTMRDLLVPRSLGIVRTTSSVSVVCVETNVAN
jgi:ubiquitin-conjugating enzyme (huntingtin interacting protein 2)